MAGGGITTEPSAAPADRDAEPSHDESGGESPALPEPAAADHRSRRFSIRWSKVGPVTLVGFPVLFNLVVLAHERLVVSWVNDTALHAAMVRWAQRRISAGHVPF